jgi:hypothetical protein
MTYEMKSLRKEDLSLYYYIKDIVLKDFVECEELAGLALLPELCGSDSFVYEYVSDLEPSPTERGRGWRYLDPPSGGLPCEPYPTVSGLNGDGDPTFGIPEQSLQVVVFETTYSGLAAVSPSEYMIDYIDGRIISQRKLNSPRVTYHWNFISVVDEWAAIEAADPPVIVIDMSGTDKFGYQLGGGKKALRKVEIHVFATDPANRNDIVETLYDGLYLKSCPLYDFPTGTVLDYDGTFYGRRNQNPLTFNKLTYLFGRERILNVSPLFFDAVTARHVNLPLVMSRGRDEILLSDLNAYRSRISFDMYSYDDRNI